MRKSVGQARLELIEKGIFGKKDLHYVLYDGTYYIATFVGNTDDAEDSHVIAKAMLKKYVCEYLWAFDADANFIACYDSEGILVEVDFTNYYKYNYSQADTVQESFNNDFTLEEIYRLYLTHGPRTMSPALSNGMIVGLERMV